MTAVQQRMSKNSDVILGAVVSGFSLAEINVALGCVCAALTAVILVLRLRREWRDRNRPPEE